MDERRLGAGCPTGGSQGVGEQGENALDLDPSSLVHDLDPSCLVLDLDPSSLVLGIDLILGHSIAHE